MNPIKQANTIDEVVVILEEIIQTAITNKNPLGYFAALYKKVTVAVRTGIHKKEFEDNDRMEKLDVIFANRYIYAYYAYQAEQEVTTSWLKAFKMGKQFWPIVLQHLLIGMNAHINLDLGIAAATVSKGQPIDNLHNDFNRINEVLASLVAEVQNDLAAIWPTLVWILKKTKRMDDFLINFSMKIARNEAWKFATHLANKSECEWDVAIQARDKTVAKYTKIIRPPGILEVLFFGIIRLGERGNVAKRIAQLNKKEISKYLIKINRHIL